MGRKTRKVPKPLRRALTVRDRCCRFPGCGNTRFLDAHHIEHWAAGGETSLENLLLLCRRHHRFVHEGGYTIDEHGHVWSRHGWQIPPVPPQPPGSLTTLRDANPGLELTPRTCAAGQGDPMDLSLAVAALLNIVGRPTEASSPTPTRVCRSGP